MYVLVDRLNGREVSRHRSLTTARRARERLQRAVQRGAYLPTAICEEHADGKGVRIGANLWFGVGRLREVESP
jgi:hypothetical protein